MKLEESNTWPEEKTTLLGEGLSHALALSDSSTSMRSTVHRKSRFLCEHANTIVGAGANG